MVNTTVTFISVYTFCVSFLLLWQNMKISKIYFGFRGFSPRSLGSIALGLWWGSTSWLGAQGESWKPERTVWGLGPHWACHQWAHFLLLGSCYWKVLILPNSTISLRTNPLTHTFGGHLIPKPWQISASTHQGQTSSTQFLSAWTKGPNVLEISVNFLQEDRKTVLEKIYSRLGLSELPILLLLGKS
jgi:hypothetical protein